MNTIREIERLNKRELENCVPPEASWHTDYRDTAYVHIGGLPFTLTEGDILTIFSQFGEPTYLNLARDKDSGKSRGFAWLKYEDQRSTDLAVDNLGGATILGRTLKVDHARYKARDDADEEEERARQLKSNGNGQPENKESESEDPQDRPLLKEEVELQKLLKDHDDDDPMKEYLIEEKKQEVSKALKKLDKETRKGDKHKRRHRTHHRRRSSERRGASDDDRRARHSRDRRSEDRTNEHSRRRKDHQDHHRRHRSRTP